MGGTFVDESRGWTHFIASINLRYLQARTNNSSALRRLMECREKGEGEGRRVLFWAREGFFSFN
jgi:hypothetical protein